MRGKGSSVYFVFLTVRITPAYAGKSKLVEAISYIGMGSPPRMRGKVCNGDRAVLSAKGAAFQIQKRYPVFHLRQRL